MRAATVGEGRPASGRGGEAGRWPPPASATGGGAAAVGEGTPSSGTGVGGVEESMQMTSGPVHRPRGGLGRRRRPGRLFVDEGRPGAAGEATGAASSRRGDGGLNK